MLDLLVAANMLELPRAVNLCERVRPGVLLGGIQSLTALHRVDSRSSADRRQCVLSVASELVSSGVVSVLAVFPSPPLAGLPLLTFSHGRQANQLREQCEHAMVLLYEELRDQSEFNQV